MEDNFSDTSSNQPPNIGQIPAYYHLPSHSTPEAPYMPSSAYSSAYPYQYSYQYLADYSPAYGVSEAITPVYHAGNAPYPHQYSRNDYEIKHLNHASNFSHRFTSSPLGHKDGSNKMIEPPDSVNPNTGYPLNGMVNSSNVEQAYKKSSADPALVEFPALPTDFQNPSLSEKIICAFLIMPRNQNGFTATEILTVINTLLFSDEASVDQIEPELQREDWFQCTKSADKNAVVYKINPYCFQWFEKLQPGLHACAIERIMNMNHHDLRILQALPFASEWIGSPLNNRDQQLTQQNTQLTKSKSNDEFKTVMAKNRGNHRDVLVERATAELAQLLTACYDERTINNIFRSLSALQPAAKPAETPAIKPSKLLSEFEGLEYAFTVMVLEVLVLYYYETLYESHIGIRSRDIGYRITKKYTWLGKLPFRKLSEMVNEALELGPYIGHKRNSSRNAYWELDLNKLIHMGRVIN